MQGISLRICAIAALLALLAGCVTPQRGEPRIHSSVQPRPHWQFVPGRVADSDGYQPPAQLAVLLPMTGALAAAAAPVLDGLLTGYYAESRPRPRLHFYDTRSTPEGAREALARALADGAGQIVGPLGREEVAAVFSAPLAVPTLALNRTYGAPADNAGSYSLAPEDEGAAAVQYLLARQARRVVAISNGEDAAIRSIEALRAGLLRSGGEVLETIALGQSVNNAGTRLTAVIGEADAVFLAVRGPQARLLAPRLTQTRIGERLKVATSQLLLGTGKPQEDRVLDGIVFPGGPWPVDPARWPLPTAAPTGLPTARGAAARLFAFGVDAWSMSARLAYLAEHPEAVLSGASGTLRMGADGTVYRTPAWLTFRRGVVVVNE